MEKQELSYSDANYILLESDIHMMLDLLYCASTRIKLKDSDSVFLYIGLVKNIARHWAWFKEISIAQYKYIEILINQCFRTYSQGFYDDSLINLYKVRNFVNGLI